MLKEAERGIWDYLKKRRESLSKSLLWLTLSLLVALLLVVQMDRLPSHVKAGDIATRDIFADQDYEFIDEDATSKLREEASSRVLPVYDFEADAVTDVKSEIETAFTHARDRLKTIVSAKNGQVVQVEEEETKLRRDFMTDLGFYLEDSDYNLIRKDEFSSHLEAALIALVQPVQKNPITHDKSGILLRGTQGIVMRQLKSNLVDAAVDASGVPVLPREDSVADPSGILSLEEAQSFYDKHTASELREELGLDSIPLEKVRLAVTLAPIFVRANLGFNKAETEFRRETARNNSQNNVYKKLEKGQIIISRGARYDAGHIGMLAGMRAARLKTNWNLKFVGVLGFVMLTLLLVTEFARRHWTGFSLSLKDLTFIGLMLLGSLATLRLGGFFGTSLKDSFPFAVELGSFYYLIPLAMGALIVGHIINSQTALVFSVILALTSGILLENNLSLNAYYLLSNIFAAHIIESVEKRSTVVRCGIYLGLFNMLVSVALGLITMLSMTATPETSVFLTNAVFALGSGVFAALLMLAFSPMIETVFNYTTNIKLLEMANMNHPLLREMIVRAPGTYHHSQLVGILGEAGARVIGANSLLARVASYYHDIGKMKKPHYFIENQKGENPHDRLPPSLSALIIQAHVKDGIDLAREHKLPKVISDMIPEHQGTKLVGYFFEKARKQAESTGKGAVEERDYRYPGPKPQSREAGVIMMADTVEAAVRSMPEKSPQKIQTMVEKLVNRHFVDDQLSECDLTLKDLNRVIDAFVKILIGIYHQRVEYPEIKAPTQLTIVQKVQDEAKDPDRQSPPPHPSVTQIYSEKHH